MVDLNVDVVFAIDITWCMQPFIDMTREAVVKTNSCTLCSQLDQRFVLSLLLHDVRHICRTYCDIKNRSG